MRQQLITWLIDDIAPAIRKNHDPEGTILKFANEHNLAPALVQTLGQLFNTAKTLAFMEKSANRGATFPILDVDKMVDKYLDVRPSKSASRNLTKATTSAYDLFDFENSEKTSLAACFENVPGLKVEDEIVFSERPVKFASEDVRRDLRFDSENKHLLDTLNQAKSDYEQDAREILVKLARNIKQNELSFEKIEQDALWVHGDIIKPAVSMLADYCAADHVKIARAKDIGENRLVRENMSIINDLDKVSDCLFKLAAANGMIEETIKAATPHSIEQAERAAPPAGAKRHEVVLPSNAPPALESGDESPKSERPEPRSTGRSGGKSAPSKNAPSNATPEKGYFSHIAGAISSATEPFAKIPTHQKTLKDMLGHGRNTEQEHVDTAHEDTKHLAVLQNLLTTDDVLAEADPEVVVNMYNTVRRVAPSLAGDTNVMRVALRSMIQHDGISPFDLKSFLDTEQAGQKTEFNKRLLGEMDYGGADFSPKPSLKPQ